MDLKHIVISKVKEFAVAHPEMSFGQILYAMTRTKNLRGKPEEANTQWLRDISDNDFLTAIERVFIQEEIEQ